MSTNIMTTAGHLLQGAPVRVRDNSLNNGTVGLVIGSTNQKKDNDLIVLICERAEIISFQRKNLVIVSSAFLLGSCMDIPHPAKPPQNSVAVGKKAARDILPLRLKEKHCKYKNFNLIFRDHYTHPFSVPLPLCSFCPVFPTLT